MHRRSLCSAALSLLTLVAVSAVTFAAGIVVPPGPGTKGYSQPKMQVYKQVLKFVKSVEVGAGPQKRVAAAFTQLNGSGQVIAYVAQDPKTHENIAAVESTITHLQAGDAVELELENIGGTFNIKTAKLVEIKPGEDTPHGYVYQESYNDANTNAALVRLTKYGQSMEAILSFTKDAKGAPQPDPDLVAAVTALKPGQVVYAEISPFSAKQSLLTAIFPYKEPQTGKVSKVSEQPVDAGKTQAIDIETSDGKTLTALVPGKVINKRFIPDPNLTRLVHSFKPGTEVVYLTRDDSAGKSYIVEIAKAPPAPKTPAGTKPEKMDKK
jgi:hypothetical protein